MNTISISTEIKEKDKIDDKLTDEFKFNAEANFSKILLDFIKEGNVIRLKSSMCFEESIDSKDNYTCSLAVVLKKTIDAKGRLSHKGCRGFDLNIENNKLIKVKKPINKKITGTEKEVMKK